MDLPDAVRDWLVDLKFGVIDQAELVSRVDREIERLDDPPYFLIELSLGQVPASEHRFDLSAGRLTNGDLGRLALRLLANLNARTMNADDIAAVSARVSFHDNYVDAWLPFCTITDEADLIEQGVKDVSGLDDMVAHCLGKAAKFAAD